MFSFWGADWFGYLLEYNSQQSGWDTHLEAFYKILIDNYLTDYMQFRLIVWGGSLIFLYLTVKRMDIDVPLVTYCFVACSLVWFSYSRVTLAMSCMMYGATFFVSNKSKLNLKTFLIGIVFLVLSTFFHKSALFGIIVIALSFIGVNSRKMMTLSLISLPFLIIIASSWLMNYMQLDANSTDNEMMAQAVSSGQIYMSASQRYDGISTMIFRCLEYLPKYMLAFLCFKFIKEGNEASPMMLLFINIFFYGVLLSTVFFFDLGYNTNTVFGRFLRFSIIPMPIVLSYFYDKGYKRKLTKRILQIAIIGVLYAVTYSAYNALHY